MLDEDRPLIKGTLANVNETTKKLQPLIEDLQKTTATANKTLDHIDSLIGDNREDVHAAIVELRKTLTNTTSLTTNLDQTLNVNSEISTNCSTICGRSATTCVNSRRRS